MLRAVRFAARFGFAIEPRTWKGIRQNAGRLTGPVSWERIRDEFLKIVGGKKPSIGLELLREAGLIAQFAPELLEMVGVMQNEFHAYPVWEHALTALDNLAANENNASINLRLATLLHDIGKPRTKTAGSDRRIHFYHHEDVGAEIARRLLTRLKLPNSDINEIVQMVAQHMRIGEYKPLTWSDAAVRRFVRASGPLMDELFALHRADVSALGEEYQDISRAGLLRERIEVLQEERDSNLIASPLSGAEIMAALDLTPGPMVGKIKEYLTNEVIEGRLREDDREAATRLAREFAKADPSPFGRRG
jgi:putative nucleotidyltransferase with HDIG domain